MRTASIYHFTSKPHHNRPAVNNERRQGWSHGTPTGAAAAHCSIAAASSQSETNAKSQEPPALRLRQLPANTQLQQQLAQQPQKQQPARQQLRPQPRPAEDVCRSVSLKLKRSDSTSQTLAVIASHATHFNQINTALAYAQLARHLRFDTNENRAAALSSSSYQQLQQLALQQADRFSARQVNMIMTAMAWMHGSTSQEPANRQQQQQQQQQCDNVSSLPGSAAALSAAEAAAEGTAAAAAVADLAASLATRLQQLLDSAEPEDICHCLWSLTKLQLLHNATCSGLLITATTHGLSTGWIHMLTGKPLCSLLWVHAQWYQQQQQQQQEEGQPAGQQQQQQQWQQLLPDLVAAVMHECGQSGFLGTWTPQELSMLLWSCAVLKVQPQPMAAAVTAAVVDADASQQQQQQQLVVPHCVLQQVCDLATQQVVRFTPQGIANTCWALGKLLVPVDSKQQQQQQWQQLLTQDVLQSVTSLLNTFTLAAAAQLNFYKPQEVANLLSACARLQQKHKPLLAAVSQYVANNSHLLNPRDVFELLVGFIQVGCQPEPCVLHALVHRLGQVLDRLEPYELVATAWGLVKVFEGQQPRVLAAAAAAAAADCRMSELQDDCITTVHQVLDRVATEVVAAAAAVVAPAAAANEWQQLLADPGGRPLVMMLWAAAGSRYGSQQQKQQHGPSRAHLISWLLQQVQKTVNTCTASTLVQLLIALTRLQQQQQQQQQLVLAVCAAAEARLLPLLPHLPAEHVVWATWAVLKTKTATAAASVRSSGSSSSSLFATAGGAHNGLRRPADCAHHQGLNNTSVFLTAALDSLQQQQQQVNRLPGHAVAALLHCCARAGVTPNTGLLLPLLAAAEQQVLQMSGQQQLLLMWSLAKLPQQQQQQQQQYSRLVRKLGEQLLLQVQQQLRFGSTPAAATSSRKPKRSAHPSAAAAAAARRSQQQQQHWLHGRELVALVASCGLLQPQLQQSDLLLAAAELWQQQQQQQQDQLALVSVRAADVQTALHMLCVLSSAAAGSSALRLQLPDLVQGVLLLLQQYLQQQQCPSQPSITRGTHQPQAVAAAETAEKERCISVLALEVLSRLRCQPPQSLLLLLNQQLLQTAAQLTQQQLVAAVHALVLLGLPVQQQLLAAAKAAGLHKQQQALPFSWRLKLLWSIMVMHYKQPTAAAAAAAAAGGGNSDKDTMRLACSVLHSSAVQKHQQLLQRQPQLLKMLLQCRQLLATHRYAAAGAAVRYAPDADVISPNMLTDQLSALSKVLLGSQITAGSGRRQQLVNLLHSSEQERLAALQQYLLAAMQASSSSSSSMDVAAVQQQLAAVMPVWTQQQLQQIGLQEVAQELKTAGVAAAALRYRHLANGDVTLLVSLQTQSAGDSANSSSSSEGPEALAVVLESSLNRAVNSGKLLGPSLCRNYLLEDWGCRVVSMPWDFWLPDWVRGGVQERGAAPNSQQQQQQQQVVAEQRKVLVDRIMRMV